MKPENSHSRWMGFRVKVKSTADSTHRWMKDGGHVTGCGQCRSSRIRPDLVVTSEQPQKASGPLGLTDPVATLAFLRR